MPDFSESLEYRIQSIVTGVVAAMAGRGWVGLILTAHQRIRLISSYHSVPSGLEKISRTMPQS